MKKIFMILMVFVLAITLSGCGQTKEEALAEINENAYFVQNSLKKEIHNPLLRGELKNKDDDKSVDVVKIDKILKTIKDKNLENLQKINDTEYKEEYDLTASKIAAIDLMKTSDKVLDEIIKYNNDRITDGKKYGYYSVSSFQYSEQYFLNNQDYAKAHFKLVELNTDISDRFIYNRPNDGMQIYGVKSNVGKDMNIGLATINCMKYDHDTKIIAAVLLHNFGPKPISLMGLDIELGVGEHLYANDPNSYANHGPVMQYQYYYEEQPSHFNDYFKTAINPGENYVFVRTFNLPVGGDIFNNPLEGTVTLTDMNGDDILTVLNTINYTGASPYGWSPYGYY